MFMQEDMFNRVRNRDVLNGKEARTRRDAAIDRVEQGADPSWMDAALDALEETARREPLFSSDPVWVRLDGVEPPEEPRAMGAVFREGRKRGWITPTKSIENSKRPQCHGRPVRIWKSLILGAA